MFKYYKEKLHGTFTSISFDAKIAYPFSSQIEMSRNEKKLIKKEIEDIYDLVPLVEAQRQWISPCGAAKYNGASAFADAYTFLALKYYSFNILVI